MPSYPLRLRAWHAAVLLLGACGGDDDQGAGAGSGGSPANAGGGSGSGSGASASGGGSGGAWTSGTGAGGADAGGGAGSGVGGVGGSDDFTTCGSTNHGSGTRVRLKLAVTAEGDERVLGFHDTALEIDCEFRSLAEGQARCLPTSIEVYAPVNSGEYFLDDTCSGMALYRVYETCTPEHLLIMEQVADDACAPTTTRMFARGAAFSVGSAPLYAREGEECVMATVESDAALYELGEEQDLTQYMAASWGRWSSAGGLAVEGYVGEDGSHRAWTFHDTARDQECTPLPLEDGALHCVAADRVRDRYTDSACTQPLASVRAACGGEPPSHGFTESSAVCETYAVYRVLEPYTAATAYDAVPTCEEGPLESAEGAVNHRTEPAAPSEMVELELVPDSSDSGRLRRMHFRNAGGACFAAGLEDTELGTDCSIDVAADGELRCLPAELARSIKSFSDPACTVEAHYVAADDCGAAAPFTRIYTPDTCSPRARVLRVLPEPIAAAELPALYFRREDGSCESDTLSFGTYFRVGDEVPPESMMPAMVEVR